MKVLVTGGAGFIGSHIVEHYLNKGDEVWVIDNLDTGILTNLPAIDRLRICEMDLANCDKLDEAVAWADLIFHAAATVGMHHVLKDPLYTLTNNLKCLEALYESLKKNKKQQRILYLSSSGVYWNTKSKDGLLHENTDLEVHPENYKQDPYTLSKLTGEVMTLNVGAELGLFVTVARVFNTVGVRQTGKYGMVLPRFIEWAIHDHPFMVYGDGQQTRSFCNVHDTVEALTKLIECDKARLEIVNVGNDREIAILDLAKLVKSVLKSKSEIIHVSYKDVFGFDFVDVRSRRPCIDKLKNLIDFHPKWTLEMTIEEIATHLKAHTN